MMANTKCTLCGKACSSERAGKCVVSVLHSAERALMDMVVQMHWLAREVRGASMKRRVRVMADALSDQTTELRALWANDGDKSVVMVACKREEAERNNG